jgi:hypothetical protein
MSKQSVATGRNWRTLLPMAVKVHNATVNRTTVVTGGDGHIFVSRLRFAS